MKNHLKSFSKKIRKFVDNNNENKDDNKKEKNWK